MSNMLLFRAIPISSATGSGGAENLATNDPKEIWTGSGTATVNFGSSQSVDSILIGHLGSAGSLTVSTFGTFSNATSSRSAPLRRHAFKRLDTPASISSLTITSTAGAVGVVAVGLAFQPTYNREWGSGRIPIDTGAREPLLGGGFGIGIGARKSGYRWTFGDLTDAEIEALHDLAENAGETMPIVVAEDPDSSSGLNERLHYGLFTRFEAFERSSPGNTRWSLSMEEWT